MGTIGLYLGMVIGALVWWGACALVTRHYDRAADRVLVGAGAGGADRDRGFGHAYLALSGKADTWSIYTRLSTYVVSALALVALVAIARAGGGA